MSESNSLPTVGEVFDLLRRRANHVQQTSDIEQGNRPKSTLTQPTQSASKQSILQSITTKQWIFILLGISVIFGWLWWSGNKKSESDDSIDESKSRQAYQTYAPEYPVSSVITMENVSENDPEPNKEDNIESETSTEEKDFKDESNQESDQNVKNEIKAFLRARKKDKK